MIRSLMRLSIAAVSAGLLITPVRLVYAEESPNEEHHPAGAAARDSQATHPDSVPKNDLPADAKKSGGMMGGDQMPQMMKMMQEMHGKMMGGGMSMQPEGDNSPSSLAFNGIMMKMHQDMAITYTGNADVDFVRGMISHHQGAIDMAKTVLAFGKDGKVRTMAEGIIEAQEKELVEMKDWLKMQGR